jgi:hypothetical protein
MIQRLQWVHLKLFLEMFMFSQFLKKYFFLILLVISSLNVASVSAQTFPDKPIKLIVPYPPGGNTDIVARLYGQKLSERLKQAVVIDNKGGAAGAIGAAIAAQFGLRTFERFFTDQLGHVRIGCCVRQPFFAHQNHG